MKVRIHIQSTSELFKNHTNFKFWPLFVFLKGFLLRRKTVLLTKTVSLRTVLVSKTVFRLSTKPFYGNLRVFSKTRYDQIVSILTKSYCFIRLFFCMKNFFWKKHVKRFFVSAQNCVDAFFESPQFIFTASSIISVNVR